MNLTPVLFVVFFLGGCVAAVAAGAQYGVYTYLLVFHMSPHHTWWDKYVPDLRYLMIAGLVAVLSGFGRKDPFPGEQWFRQPGFILIISFNAWLWLSSVWVRSPFQIDGCVLFLKHLLISAVIYKIAKERRSFLKVTLLFIVMGSAWFGYLTMGKGGRVEGVAGAIADANTMGMHTASALLISAMMVLGLKGWYRWIPFLCAPFILNTIIQSGSRGAFLGVIAGGAVAYVYCPKRLTGRFLGLGVGGLILFFMLAHDQFISRLVELYESVGTQEEELDHSAASRVAVAQAQWQMALDYPMGVGHKGTALLSPKYIEEQYLTRGSAVGMEAGRGSHNSYLAALVSYGFVGFLLFSSFYIWAGITLLKLKSRVSTPDQEELSIIVAGVAAGLTAPFVSGQFSNFVYAENQFWLFALVAALPKLIHRELALVGGEHRGTSLDPTGLRHG